MNRQSDMMAAFEENIIWSELLSANVIVSHLKQSLFAIHLVDLCENWDRFGVQ